MKKFLLTIIALLFSYISSFADAYEFPIVNDVNAKITIDETSNIAYEYNISNCTFMYLTLNVEKKLNFSNLNARRIYLRANSYLSFGENINFNGLEKSLAFYNGNHILKADSIAFNNGSEAGIYLYRKDLPKLTMNINYLEVIGYGIQSSNVNSVLEIDSGIVTSNIIKIGQLKVGTASISSFYGITINDGSSIEDFEGNSVYQVKLPHNNDKNFLVQKGNGSVYQDFKEYSFKYFHKDVRGNTDPCYYIYLPNGDYNVTTGSETYTFTVSGEAVDLTLKPVIAGDGIINLSGGEFSWLDGGYLVGNQPYTYNGSNGYTLTGTTTGTVKIPANFACDSITLKNLTIDRSKAVTADKAIAIEKTGDFEIIIEGTSNLLSKNEGSSVTTANINYLGTGTLTIRGLESNNSDTLYLSRKTSITGRKLIVKSGTVVVEGYFDGGNYILDGGTLFSGDSLIIDGGISSSYHLNERGVTVINGGQFSLYKDRDLHVGGEIPPVSINGGTIYLEFKNQKDPGITKTTKINGGSVHIENNAKYFEVEDVFAAKGCPTRTGGTEVIYQSIYKLPVPAGTAVDSIKADGVLYPCKDVLTDADSSVYLWLPETEDIGSNPVTRVSIFINGIEFKFGGFVDMVFKYVPYIDAMNPGQGNKQELIPFVSNATSNGSFTLSGDYMTEYNNEWYACSKSEVAVTVTPEANYELESISVNGTALAYGETNFTVVRPDQILTQMEVNIQFNAISTAIHLHEVEKIKIFGVENGINIQGAERATVQIINLRGTKIYEKQNINTETINLKKGIYIVLINNKAHKIQVQ